MRTSRAIDALFPRTRQAILAATVLHPERWWYLSALAKHLTVRPSSLQRELATLVEAGILEHHRDGNRVYFRPHPDCPLLADLQGLLIKTVGLVDVLRETLAPFDDRLEWAVVYGSMARAEELASSDVDVLLIGRVGLAELAPGLRQAEARLGRPVHPILYTREDFVATYHAGQAVLHAILQGETLWILGESHALAAAVEQ